MVPKKITIHVGGRGGSVDSPTVPSALESPASGVNGVSTATAPSAAVEKARGASAATASPSPSTKPPKSEDAPGPSPARPASVLARSASVENGPQAENPPVHAIEPQIVPIPQPSIVYEPKRLRPVGKGMETSLKLSPPVPES